MRVISLLCLCLSLLVSPSLSSSLSCLDEKQSGNRDVDATALKNSLVIGDWDSALQTLSPKSWFDPAFCVGQQPVTHVLLHKFLFSEKEFRVQAKIRELLIVLLERGVNPNTVGSPDGEEGPTPLALVLKESPYDVALVRALMIGGHTLTTPRLAPYPTYLHMFPDIYASLRRTLKDRMVQALYVIRHRQADSLEGALTAIALAHDSDLSLQAEQTAEVEVDPVTGEVLPQTPMDATATKGHERDPRLLMDGLFEASKKFQSMDFTLLEFLQSAEAGRQDFTKIDRHIGVRETSWITVECMRSLLLLMLNSPSSSDMLAADQLLLENPETGHNMIHAIVSVGDEHLLGPFVDELRGAILESLEPEDEFSAATPQLDDSEFNFEADYDDDQSEVVPASPPVATDGQGGRQSRLEGPAIQILKTALTHQDILLKRTPMHYAATLEAKLVSIMRELVAVSMGLDGVGVGASSSEALAQEQAAFPELYNLTDILGETVGRYFKLYNTETVEGDRPAEEAPATKSAREIHEAAEENVTPSEYESVNRVMLMKTTLRAKQELRKQTTRLESILNHEPVGRIFDPYDLPESEFSGPTTVAQRKARQDLIAAAYINYDDEEQVAQELELQKERVAQAQAKLDEKLAMAELDELPKPPHMMDPAMSNKPEALGPRERILQRLKIERGETDDNTTETDGFGNGPQPVEPHLVAGCDVVAPRLDEFANATDMFTHLLLSEVPIILRGEDAPATASAARLRDPDAPTGASAFDALLAAGTTPADASLQKNITLAQVSQELRRLLTHQQHVVHRLPQPIEELPPSLLRKEVDLANPASSDFFDTLLSPETFNWITHGTTCHVAIDDVDFNPYSETTTGNRKALPGTIESKVISSSTLATDTLRTVAKGIAAKSVHGSGPDNAVAELMTSARVSFGGPGSGKHMDSSDSISVVLQLEGAQNWVLLPPKQAMSVGESTLSFFKSTLPEIYDTRASVCALHPGDVLLLPPRYSHASFRVTESLDVAMDMPSVSIPFAKTEETNPDEE